MQTLDRNGVRKKLHEGEEPVTLVEVLSEEEFRTSHLPGAINVPFGDDFEKRIQQAVPDKSREVIVYCQNKECSASPRAAEALEALGYEHVFDYEKGKEDWEEGRLPVVS